MTFNQETTHKVSIVGSIKASTICTADFLKIERSTRGKIKQYIYGHVFTRAKNSWCGCTVK